MTIKYIISISLLILLIADWAVADDKGLQVRFVAERLPGNLGEVILANKEYKSEPFDLPKNKLSAPINVPVRTLSLLYPEKKLSLATIKLPEEGNSFIVLLIPSGREGYKSVVMPYENPDFRGGDFYFYNNTRKSVFGIVGKSKFSVKSGESSILRPSGARKERFYDVALGFRDEGKSKVISTTRWREDNRIRSYMFFYENPKSGWVTYRAVDEFVMPQ